MPPPETGLSDTQIEHKGSPAEPQVPPDTKTIEPVPEPTASLSISALTAALETLTGTRFLREFRLRSLEDDHLNRVRAQLSAAILRCRKNARRNATR